MLDMASPSSSNFQQWMTYESVGKLVSNPQGTNAIRQWLQSAITLREFGNNMVNVTATISWESKNGEYIRAVAPLSHWENLLQTQFFEHQDLQPHYKVDNLIINLHI